MQKRPLSLIDAASDQIRSLRVANVRVVLIGVTTPNHQIEALRRALDAFTSRSDIIGILEDGSIGILCFLPIGVDLASDVMARFVPRLRLHLLEQTNGEMSPVRIRAVDRTTSELSDVTDLTNALFCAHDFAVSLTVRKPLGISSPLFSKKHIETASMGRRLARPV